MKKSFILIFFIIAPYRFILAQLSGYHMLEYQYGLIPGISEQELSTLYDNIELNYRQDNIKAGIRIEQFLNKIEKRNYQHIAQYNLNYKKNGLDVRAGHFYDIIGNGLLLRSYEIKGSILQDPVHLSKHGFYRDIQGVYAKYQTKNIMIKALKGTPLINELPPTFNRTDRRVDNIEALEFSINIKKQMLGLAFLRNVNDFVNNKYASVYTGGILPLNISYNLEMARELGNNENKPFEFKDKSSYAVYLGLNFSIESFGTSLEIKDYRNFFLGSGFSDPPALVKEHTYKVLNRSTHVPHLTDESGIQLESFYYFQNGTFITFNTVHLKNDVPSSKSYYFNEYFIELQTYLNNNSLKTFFDYANDPFKGEKNRLSTGISFEKTYQNFWSSLLNFEYQHLVREIVKKQKIHNVVAELSFSRSPTWNIGILWETTNDPLITEKNNKRKNQHYTGLNLGYKLDSRNSFNLFFGSRRGGPACTSGICYEVLDFKGIELRITNKF